MKEKYISIEIKNLPQRSVPMQLNSDDASYKRIIPLDLTNVLNEIDMPAGLFGWCTKCRNKADFYCKDLRVPICSIECKFEYT